MNNKSIRDYINLIESAQQSVAEGTDFAGRPVDQELVKRQEKFWNQAAKEKKQQELKRSRQLKKPGVTEDSDNTTQVYRSKSEWMAELKQLNPDVEFVRDDRGIIADQGPGKKIAGEWTDDFSSGVIYRHNILPKIL